MMEKQDWKLNAPEIGIRTDTSLLIGVAGGSFSGKTLSMIRLAKGIQEVIKCSDEQIHFIDTENERGKHYCPKEGEKANPPHTYRFNHIKFEEPYASLKYRAQIEQCEKDGAKIIIVDQFSFEHVGVGGYLDYHEKEVERLMKAWDTNKEEKVHWPAFNRPSQARKALLMKMATSSVKYFLCGYRAEKKTEKKTVDGKQKIVDLGYQPIGGPQFWYEMTLRILLYPGSAGVPIWNPTFDAEKELIKLPDYLKHIFTDPKRQLDESMGAELARWSKGGAAGIIYPSKDNDRPTIVDVPASSPSSPSRADKVCQSFSCDFQVEQKQLEAFVQRDKAKWTDADMDVLKTVYQKMRKGAKFDEFSVERAEVK